MEFIRDIWTIENGRHKLYAEYICECGKVFKTRKMKVVSGDIISCGCQPLTADRLKEKLIYDRYNGYFFNHAKKRVHGHINKEGYVYIRVVDTLYPAHRLAWLYVYGSLPPKLTHIDKNRSNNRIANLKVWEKVEHRELTQDILHSSIEYDPFTGLFSKKGTPNANGYIYIRVAGKLHSAHRLAWLYMYGEWPHRLTHIDGNRSNNAIHNLKEKK